MSEYELMLDAGHGGKDPGVVKGSRIEKEWTLKITNYQLKRFKDLGISVSATRTTDKTLSNNERTALSKQGKYCFSNHLNAGGGDRGEVIHSIFDDGKLAHAISESLKSAGQSTVKVYFREGNNKKDYYYMHRETGATKTNIIEYCFLDNEKDFSHFEKNWEEYAEAVVRAYCQYTGRKYHAPINMEPSKEKVFYRVVTGSFTDRENAEKRISQLKSKGFDSFIDILKK